MSIRYSLNCRVCIGEKNRLTDLRHIPEMLPTNIKRPPCAGGGLFILTTVSLTDWKDEENYRLFCAGFFAGTFLAGAGFFAGAGALVTTGITGALFTGTVFTGATTFVS
jgi:hypothetical protein